MKTMSIPRLELQAAYLAATLDMNIKSELGIEVSTTFWTDSAIVLAYIKNTTRRFQVFVSNRISFIHRSTMPSQWHHIPGNQNPADLLIRDITVPQMNSTWFYGPEFLHAHKSSWPFTKDTFAIPVGDPELKKSIISHYIRIDDHPLKKILQFYSDWTRLLRGLAWLVKIRNLLLKRDSNKFRAAFDVKNAERIIILHTQQEAYSEEILRLSMNKPLLVDSKIRTLSPYLDDGLLVISSRLKHSIIPLRHKEPFIIPYKSITATLIARHYHNRAHHGLEWTLSIIRQRFWITRARALLKRIKHQCIICKRLFDSAVVQRMADLPLERISIGKPPCTTTGCDCFGPFNVIYRRSNIVRYGCLFTCMNTRAIHIGKLDTLEADSFLNAFRRSISRRGTPDLMISDNGTNFTSANKQIHFANQELVRHFCATNMIERRFIPPKTSHFGGSWERMILTVRKVFSGILGTANRMTDEILQTFFCEAESIINGRPLTKASDDVNDSSARTPNHLLILRPNPNMSLGISLPNDVFRARWRYVQYLTNLFWSKWTREYLPQLHMRSKWLMACRNVRVGDLMLIMDEHTPRSLWPLGLVIDVNVGRDGLVRSVRLKTKSTESVRPVTKIVFLEAFGDDVMRDKK